MQQLPSARKVLVQDFEVEILHDHEVLKFEVFTAIGHEYQAPHKKEISKIGQSQPEIEDFLWPRVKKAWADFG